MKNKYFLILLLILLAPVVNAMTYTPTGRQDFSVYVDSQPELDDFVYASVEINQTKYPGDFKCITMLFANQSGTFLHVQSNPPHLNPTKMGVVVPNKEVVSSPEALGYFPVHNGLANVYFRAKDVIAYNNFLFVVICKSNSTELIYEESLHPLYREFGKDLPSRGVWLARSENADKIVFVLAVVFLVILFLIWYLRR